MISPNVSDQGKPHARLLLAHADELWSAKACERLRNDGYRLLVSIHGAREVLRFLLSRPLDLLILGQDLPDIEDVWLLVRIVRSGRFCRPKLPVLMVCTDPDLKTNSGRAHEQSVRIVPKDQLPKLPSAVAVCLAGDHKPRVLLVEDHEDAARVIQSSLAGRYHVEIAADGECGLAAWESRRHALVLLDMKLPRLTGEEVLQKILVVDPSQPVIVLTAHASLDHHEEMVFRGAFDFVPKPCDVRRLRLICDRALQHRDYVEAARERQTLLTHIHAATQCLTEGRTWIAAECLSDALAMYPEDAPSDAELEELIAEFEV